MGTVLVLNIVQVERSSRSVCTCTVHRRAGKIICMHILDATCSDGERKREQGRNRKLHDDSLVAQMERGGNRLKMSSKVISVGGRQLFTASNNMQKVEVCQ